MASHLVNPSGYVHDVNDDAVEGLLESGYRLATSEEIANYYTVQGLPVPAGEKAAPKRAAKAPKAEA